LFGERDVGVGRMVGCARASPRLGARARRRTARKIIRKKTCTIRDVKGKGRRKSRRCRCQEKPPPRWSRGETRRHGSPGGPSRRPGPGKKRWAGAPTAARPPTKNDGEPMKTGDGGEAGGEAGRGEAQSCGLSSDLHPGPCAAVISGRRPWNRSAFVEETPCVQFRWEQAGR